jgi:hypothetical protein
MNFDWAVAVSVFLIFIGMGFAYYWGLFEANPDPVGISLDTVNGKVIGFLSVNSWSAPVRYNSSGPDLQTLYLDFSWPEGTKNSTNILDSGLPLDCMLQGDRLYFQANVESGDNDFLMTFANESGPPACDSTLETSGANQSVPWASEKSVRISQSRINQMLATEYVQFRQSLGINRNMRIEIDSVGTSAYGPSPPQYTSTYVKVTNSMIQETGQTVTVRVMMW